MSEREQWDESVQIHEIGAGTASWASLEDRK